MSAFFNGDEIALITNKLKNLLIENLVFCSFENRFAKAGGLASVITNILPYLKEVNHIPSVFLVSPLYPEIMDMSALKSTGKKFTVAFLKKSVHVELYEYTWNYSAPQTGSLKEYYIKADGFFEAQKRLKNPYVYHEDNMELNNEAMNKNALFYCKAVPFVLKSLDIRSNTLLHLHEWQTALISLTAKEALVNGTLDSCGTVQTMHNSFDSVISWKLLTQLLDKSRKEKTAGLYREGLTAYEIGLQLVDAPVTTVSGNFADELTTDIIQTRHFAPHLQHILKTSTVCGIDNGMFIDFSSEFPKRDRHTLDEIRSIKLKKRKTLLRLLTTYRPEERFGELTYKRGPLSGLPDTVPIFLMSGRLDPLQKGYDIFLRAVERFNEDEIKVILTPMPVNRNDLDYFYEVACKCKGNVTVFPIKMEKGYHELQTGSTFGVMSSIYEPFGAAVEYMANGTVNIGRATGGLIDQIDSTCGFLFREDPASYTLENVLAFVESAGIVQTRKANAWIQSMSDNLYKVLQKAVNMYRCKPDRYYQMIRYGFKKAGRFTWESNARKYFEVYKAVSRA